MDALAADKTDDKKTAQNEKSLLFGRLFQQAKYLILWRMVCP
jgi:hypothetical protein